MCILSSVYSSKQNFHSQAIICKLWQLWHFVCMFTIRGKEGDKVTGRAGSGCRGELKVAGEGDRGQARWQIRRLGGTKHLLAGFTIICIFTSKRSVF